MHLIYGIEIGMINIVALKVNKCGIKSVKFSFQLTYVIRYTNLSAECNLIEFSVVVIRVM